VDGVIVAGHGVASGRKEDPRFPDGTLAMQIPRFATLGLDLTGFWPGTLNVSIRPAQYRPGRAAFTFRDVKWHPDEPAEDFSFFECRVLCGDSRTGALSGWIYYPHPETKPEHFQAADVLEVIAPRIKKIGAGSRVRLSTPIRQMSFQFD
jgi:hypothetical protein